jgi:hypothetical protein
MIEIVPLVDEDNWGGKRWLDARPFDWGNRPDDNYEKTYRDVAIDYLNNCYPGDLDKIPYDGEAYDTDGRIINNWVELGDLAIESIENFL